MSTSPQQRTARARTRVPEDSKSVGLWTLASPPASTPAYRPPRLLWTLTGFLLVVLAVTGLYMAQFFDPSPLGAYDSTLYIVSRAPLGDWVRSIHYWAAGIVLITVVGHLALVFWRRSYLESGGSVWWFSVGLVALLFLLVVTGTALRADQGGYEALSHFVAGAKMVGPLGAFFTERFTTSTPLLTRVYSLHSSLLPLALLALVSAYQWLIGRPAATADAGTVVPMARLQSQWLRVLGVSLVAFAILGFLAAVLPTTFGARPVAGVELTKPFWPLLWVYGLENTMGAWGIVLGPAVLFGLFLLVPLADRGVGSARSRWLVWAVVLVGSAVLVLWLYGAFGPKQPHLGM